MAILVLKQSALKLRCKWHQTRLAELTFPHLHQAVRKIYISPIQSNEFSDAQPGGVNHQQYEVQRSGLKARRPLEPLGSLQQARQFLVRIDVRNKDRWPLGKYRRQRRSVNVSSADCILIKT